MEKHKTLLMEEYQISLAFNRHSFISNLQKDIDVMVERTYTRHGEKFATITVTGKNRKKSLLNLLCKKFAKECDVIGEMQCADPSKVPPAITRAAQPMRSVA